MKKIDKSPLAIAIGATLAVGMSSSVTHAESNPFAVNELSGGYMQVAEARIPGEATPDTTEAAEKDEKAKTEGKCGEEGKCGGKKGEKAATDEKK